MAKKTAEHYAGELLKKVQDLHQTTPAGIYGTTQGDSMLLQLRKTVGGLCMAVKEKQPFGSIMERYEEMMSSIDAAGITGLLSEDELTDYYSLTDSLWAAIEKEK